MPALAECLAQRARILDDAVVHERDGAAAVRVRMRVGGVGHAVRRPAGVRERGGALRELGAELPLQHGDLPGRAKDLEFPAAVDDGEAGRVIAAILEALETLEDDRGRWSLPGVPYDAAHNRRPSAISRSASAPVGASAISRMMGSVPEGRTCSQRSGHASRSPSWVSTAAPGNPRRRPSYTGSRRGPRGIFAFTIVYRGARATTSLTVTRSRASSDSTSAAATGASRPTCKAGYITPPLPSPPITAFSSMILRATYASPTGARTTVAPNCFAASSTTKLVDRLQTTLLRFPHPPSRFPKTALMANASV